MLKVRIFILLFVSLSTAAYAQNIVSAEASISATATRSINLPPKEVTFHVTVISGSETTLEQVVHALEGTGITAQDLVGVGSSGGLLTLPPIPPRPERLALVYRFRLSVPFARMKETAEKLESAGRRLAGNTALQFTFVTAPSQATIAETRQRIVPELIAEARRKAIFLANAGQVNLGPIESISEHVNLGTIESIGETPTFFPSEVLNRTVISPFSGSTQLRVSFTVTVRFSLQ